MNTQTRTGNPSPTRSGLNRNGPLRARQSGMTLISWIIVILFILFQVIIAMNVIPVYISDSSVKAMMKDLPDDIKAREATTTELRSIIMKRLKINNVRSVSKDDIYITKGRGEYLVEIEYEPRGTLIGNLDYIVTFSHEAVIPIDR